jgi:hypothetical protein
MSHPEAIKTYAKLLKALVTVAAAIFYLSTGTKPPRAIDVLKM